MSENNQNKKNNCDNSNKMCDNIKYDKELFDNGRVNNVGTTYDIVLSVKISNKMNNILRKKTAKGKVQMPYKLHDSELPENDLEIIRTANWNDIREKFGIDLAQAKNNKVTIKTKVFPPKIQVGDYIKQSENHVKPVLDINNNDIKKDLEILNRFNRYNLLKNFGIDLAQAKSNKVTTQTEAFPAKNSINVQNKDNDFKEDKNNSSEKALPEQNAVLFFNESVIKQIENQNNNSFVSYDFFDKECHFEINKAEQLNILPQGTSDFKSTDPKNTLRYLKIIKWLSGIFGCGILISLIVLWQFFNPLLTAVSVITFLVGSAIDITIFVVAWRACSYLNNSVHELNQFPHLSNNKNVSIKINNQERNKNQSLIPSSDKNNKNNDLTGQK